MAHDFSLWQVILKGGWTIVVLLLMSIVVFAILLERWRAFRKAQGKREDLLAALSPHWKGKDASSAIAACEDDGSLLAHVAGAGLRAAQSRQKPAPAMEREARARLMGLETNLAVLGTIGGIAPFVGLFGTVLGIIRAFKDLALASAGGAAVVSQGIAEALVATAAGLFVAISAVVIYNLFHSRLDRMGREAELLISELSERLGQD